MDIAEVSCITETYLDPIAYPNGTRKFRVIYEGRQYSCYLNCWQYNVVCTGDGKSDKCRDITDTKLGQKIILACMYH